MVFEKSNYFFIIPFQTKNDDAGEGEYNTTFTEIFYFCLLRQSSSGLYTTSTTFQHSFSFIGSETEAIGKELSSSVPASPVWLHSCIFAFSLAPHIALRSIDHPDWHDVDDLKEELCVHPSRSSYSIRV